ncbi:MAG: tetratricopeptide repeat protein [Spirochaetota bacterium]
MITKEKEEVLRLYNAGLDAYKMRKWDEAIDCFEKALKVDPNDGPSKLYLERCKQYKLTTPQDDCDGVFTMTTK